MGMFPKRGHVDLRSKLRGITTPKSHICRRTEIFWEKNGCLNVNSKFAKFQKIRKIFTFLELGKIVQSPTMYQKIENVQNFMKLGKSTIDVKTIIFLPQKISVRGQMCDLGVMTSLNMPRRSA